MKSAIVVLLFVLTAGCGRKMSEEESLRARDYVAATNAISGQLIAPRTAIFSGEKEIKYDGANPNRRILEGNVDAQNEAGGLVRNEWRVEFGGHDDIKKAGVYPPDTKTKPIVKEEFDMVLKYQKEWEAKDKKAAKERRAKWEGQQ